MLQFHKNSLEMGKCIIYRKLLTILILEPGSLWKSAPAHTQSTSLLLQNHLQKENISMKKNIFPSNNLSAVRSSIPGPPGSSVYRTLKEISSSVQCSLCGSSIFRAFKRKIFYAWAAPSLLSDMWKRNLPPQVASFLFWK